MRKQRLCEGRDRTVPRFRPAKEATEPSPCFPVDGILELAERISSKGQSVEVSSYDVLSGNWSTGNVSNRVPTNMIESYHRQLRKVTKGKSIFPSDDALLKMLYLATQDVMRKWTGRMQNWGQILLQLSIFFPEKVRSHLR